MYCFDAGGREFPKMCGWLMKTIHMTCAKTRFLKEASVSLPSDPNVDVYVLHFEFILSSFFGRYLFLSWHFLYFLVHEEEEEEDE
jgi:hypothetical protein